MKLNEKNILEKLKKELTECGIEINKLLANHSSICDKIIKELKTDSDNEKIGCITLAVKLGELNAFAKVHEKIKHLEKSCD